MFMNVLELKVHEFIKMRLKVLEFEILWSNFCKRVIALVSFQKCICNCILNIYCAKSNSCAEWSMSKLWSNLPILNCIWKYTICSRIIRKHLFVSILIMSLLSNTPINSPGNNILKILLWKFSLRSIPHWKKLFALVLCHFTPMLWNDIQKAFHYYD